MRRSTCQLARSRPLETRTISYVGVSAGGSQGKSGLGIMHYVNPITGNLSWQRMWVFGGDAGVHWHVMINSVEQRIGIPAAAESEAPPVFSVLDQGKHTSNIVVNGNVLSTLPDNSEERTITWDSVETLWHGDVG